MITALIGRFIPSVAFLYSYAWFVGFFLSGVIYYLMMLAQGRKPALATEPIEAIE